MNIIFVNPQLIAKIEKKVDKLMARWNYPKDQRFQLFEMVATIELGYAKKTFYWEDGLVCDGWNGYRHTLQKMTRILITPGKAFIGLNLTRWSACLST